MARGQAIWVLDEDIRRGIHALHLNKLTAAMRPTAWVRYLTRINRHQPRRFPYGINTERPCSDRTRHNDVLKRTGTFPQNHTPVEDDTHSAPTLGHIRTPRARSDTLGPSSDTQHTWILEQTQTFRNNWMLGHARTFRALGYTDTLARQDSDRPENWQVRLDRLLWHRSG